MLKQFFSSCTKRNTFWKRSVNNARAAIAHESKPNITHNRTSRLAPLIKCNNSKEFHTNFIRHETTKKTKVVEVATDSNFRVVIIGRPNVGKSTLFNKLVGRSQAIVFNTPGVTRDYQEGEVVFENDNFSSFLKLVMPASEKKNFFQFTIIDTPGADNIDKVIEQTAEAIRSADAGILVTDAKAGLTEWDHKIAQYLQKQSFPVFHILNKYDAMHQLELESIQEDLDENTIDQLGSPIPISAENGFGFELIYNALLPLLMKHAVERRMKQIVELKEREGESDGAKKMLRLAIVGKPNVGKSTLINSLLGSNRVVVSDVPGTTRDAIEVKGKFEDKDLVLVDTAGFRKRKITDKDLIERMSFKDTLRSIKFANVVALLIDSTVGVTHEELEIASMVEREGRGMVIVANKWDLVKQPHHVAAGIEDKISKSLSQISGLSVVVCSGLKELNLKLLIQECLACYERWSARIPTSRLNRFIHQYIQIHQANLPKDFPKIHYLTQVSTRPPTFAIFFTKAEEIPQRFERQLINAIRDEFSLGGVPVRVIQRRSAAWSEANAILKSKKKKKQATPRSQKPRQKRKITTLRNKY